MDKIILPVISNVALTTDCRIQQRLAIIQTSPHGRAWLATHMDIFMDDHLSIGFGTGTHVAGFHFILKFIFEGKVLILS